ADAGAQHPHLHVPRPAPGLLDVRPFQARSGRDLAQCAHLDNSSSGSRGAHGPLRCGRIGGGPPHRGYGPEWVPSHPHRRGGAGQVITCPALGSAALAAAGHQYPVPSSTSSEPSSASATSPETVNSPSSVSSVISSSQPSLW